LSDIDVSVVIPTRDRPWLLKQTLWSVLQQRGVVMEVVVVDDGSAMDVRDVVIAAGDPRIRYRRHHVGRGVAAARNTGIAAARGAWLAFCDDDDLWAPDKLEQQLTAAATQRRAWACAGAVEVDTDLRIVGGTPPDPPQAIVRNLERWDAVPAGASNVIASRDALRAVGNFCSALPHLDDWDMWLRLARYGVPSVVGAPLVAYRRHFEQRSADAHDTLSEVALLEERNGIVIDRSAFHLYVAQQQLRSSRIRGALMSIARSVRSSPRPLAAANLGLRTIAGHVLDRPTVPPRHIAAWQRSADWIQDARMASTG
jgi:glycosyltransferase involved in cell wall biosynthesis